MPKIQPDEVSFDRLMTAVETFKLYLETEEEFDECVLLDLHSQITCELCNMLGWSDLPIELDWSDIDGVAEDGEEDGGGEGEHVIPDRLVTTCELRAFAGIGGQR